MLQCCTFVLMKDIDVQQWTPYRKEHVLDCDLILDDVAADVSCVLMVGCLGRHSMYSFI